MQKYSVQKKLNIPIEYYKIENKLFRFSLDVKCDTFDIVKILTSITTNLL